VQTVDDISLLRAPDYGAVGGQRSVPGEARRETRSPMFFLSASPRSPVPARWSEGHDAEPDDGIDAIRKKPRSEHSIKRAKVRIQSYPPEAL
jgi:hypothetical protein